MIIFFNIKSYPVSRVPIPLSILRFEWRSEERFEGRRFEESKGKVLRNKKGRKVGKVKKEAPDFE